MCIFFILWTDTKKKIFFVCIITFFLCMRDFFFCSHHSSSKKQRRKIIWKKFRSTWKEKNVLNVAVLYSYGRRCMYGYVCLYVRQSSVFLFFCWCIFCVFFSFVIWNFPNERFWVFVVFIHSYMHIRIYVFHVCIYMHTKSTREEFEKKNYNATTSTTHSKCTLHTKKN